MEVELFLDAGATLAEGPVWDDVNDQLIWVDILEGKIHRTHVDGTDVHQVEIGEHVGAVVPTSNGDLLAATRSGIRLVDPAARHPLLAVMPNKTDGMSVRMNDGKCDPRGRFVVGSKADDDSPGAGTLWSFDGIGLTPVLAHVTISNGLAWSDDGSTLFYVDTPTGRIDRFDYDLDAGVLGHRRAEVQIPSEHGSPDGLTIDRDGGLWVALWGGAAVHRYERGALSEKIEMPSTYTTSCTFGGESLSTLFITSAKDDTTGRPGAIHAVELDTSGHPPVRFDTRVVASTTDGAADDVGDGRA